MREIYIFNGKLIKKQEINFKTLERGFLYGDGLFETLISKNFKIFRFSQHYLRMKKGAEICHMVIESENLIKNWIETGLKKSRLKNAYIRVNVWRKKGERIKPEGEETNILIIIKNYSPYPRWLYKNGLDCVISKKIFRNEKSPVSRIKSFNFLENIIGKIEAKENKCDDVIFLNTSGFLAEATVANLFFVCKDKVYTPGCECGILDGITRKIVIEICKENGIKIIEGNFKPDFLKECDEVFMTNTLFGIISIRKIENFFIERKRDMTKFISEKYFNILKEETDG